MAFIIPMLGRSSRFFNEGYSVPKYQLQLSDKSTFFHAISSFEKYFKTTKGKTTLRQVLREFLK